MDKYQDPYIPGPSNGELQGVDTSMPDRGTSSGFVGMGSPYGADVGVNATNRIRGIGRSTQSDAMGECYPQGGGDFSSSGGDHSTVSGRGMGGAAKSDAVSDDRADDQRQ